MSWAVIKWRPLGKNCAQEGTIHVYLQSDAAIQRKELECQQECGIKKFLKVSDLQQYYRYIPLTNVKLEY